MSDLLVTFYFNDASGPLLEKHFPSRKHPNSFLQSAAGIHVSGLTFTPAARDPTLLDQGSELLQVHMRSLLSSLTY